MTSKYDVNGVDLDSIFAPYTTGTQPAATKYTVNGVDLNQRYAPLSQGSAAQVTGYDVAGVGDLNTLFAAANTTTVTVGTQPGNVSGSAAAGDPSGTVTSNTTTCAGSGGTGSYSYKWTIASGTATLTAPNSATTGVTATVNANSTITGTMYCTISDGISSAQTNTVNWSLQNTSLPVSISTQPSNVSGSSAAGDPTGTVTSNTTTVVAANGTGSYTYQWYMASGSGASFTAGTSATTAVTGSVNADSTNTGTMYCVVTDSAGSTATSNTVSWSLQNTTIPVSISSQPSNVSGSANAGYPSGTVTSGTTGVTAANGTGSYSYQWKIASGSGASFTAPTSATTAVTGTVNANSTNSGTMYCVVKDSTGGTVNSNTVNWSLQNTDTAVYISSQPSNVSGSAAAGTPSGTVTSNTTSVTAANGTGSYTYQWNIASGSGVEFTNPTAATTAVTGTVNASTTNSGTMYCTVKDSSNTTVNSNTVSWSLQNTSIAQWSFSITAGQRIVSSNSWTGYETNLGSGSGLTSPDGHTLNSLVDTTQTDGVDGATFSIAGFSADPGQGYFYSLTANGKTQYASGATYSYSSGVATWVWNLTGSTADMFGFASGSTYPCVMNY